LSATGGASGNPVAFSVQSGPGSISGNTLSINGVGTIVVAANQAGNTNYASAPTVTQSIVVNPSSSTGGGNANPELGTVSYQTTTTTSTCGQYGTTKFTSYAYSNFVYTGPTSGPSIPTQSFNVTFTYLDVPAGSTNCPPQGWAAPPSGFQLVGSQFVIYVNTSSNSPSISTHIDTVSLSPMYGSTNAYGTPLTFTATQWLTGAAGTFTFYDGTTALATVPLSGGQATYTTSSLSASASGQSHNITATYNSSNGYSSESSQPLVETITQAAPVITWAAPAAITYGTALSSTQLNATANVPGTFSYSPASGTVLTAGSKTLSVTFTPTDTTDYTTATKSVSLTVNQATPVITWAAPAAITYGTALSSTQLNATANVPGTLSYSPASGAVLTAGSKTLSVTFTPTDTTDYTTATKSVSLTVNQATPVITWAAPAAITYGTALSSTQLSATANVPGTFSYSPASGTVLSAGSKTLSVTFTPTDTADYTTATKSVSLTVNQATPVITWAAPAAITYGTALSSTQLNATANVPGTFSYSPASGAVLTAGSKTLSVTFTPTDTTDYTTATKSVSLTVNQVIPVVTWATPAPISYGTALSATQLNATANVPGSFSYSPASGTVPTAGASKTLSVTFTPTDTVNYATATKSVSITVNKLASVITWNAPAPIFYGTAISTTQLNATANVPGAFSYSPAAGTVLSVGTNTLSATFIPSDTTDYTNANASVSINTTFLPPTNTINTIAGNGPCVNPEMSTACNYGYHGGSYSGDGSPAPSATLNMPNGVAVDNTGNLYIADWSNCAVRKVMASTGAISTIAGRGCSSGYLGEGGLATNAYLGQWIKGVAVDSTGNTYLASQDAYRILKVNAASGIITTIAGNGTAGHTGDGGPAAKAQVSPLGGITLDGNGNLYFSEGGYLREILAADGSIRTIAGNGSNSASAGDGGPALRASFYAAGLSLDASGNIYLADTNNNTIRKIDTSHIITTVVGNGTKGFGGDGSPALSASLSYPNIAVPDRNGNLYVADTANYRIRKVTAATGNISTIAGNGTAGFSGDGGPAPNSVVNYPEGLTVDSSGDIYVADTFNNRVRVITVPQIPPITWSTPSPILYGTPLSATQLNATTTVPGTFAYTPASGTVLKPGDQTLTVKFTPTDNVTYSVATATVILTVEKANPVITWPALGTVNNGTMLGSAQLNATASVPGVFQYFPPSGTALTMPGLNVLAVLFSPTDTTDYNEAVGSTTITVNPPNATDSGTVALTVNGSVISTVTYGFESTPISIADSLAQHVSSTSPVTVTAVDDTLYLQSKQMGSAYNYSYSLQTTSFDSTDFSHPSFAYPAISGVMDGGATAGTGTPAPVYNYTVAYDGVGNVSSFSDSVMGTWSLTSVPRSNGSSASGYDTLNRLVAMRNTATTTTSSQYGGQYLCWSYDAFGNRTQQNLQGTACPSTGPSSSNSVLTYNANNQLSSVTPPGGGSPSPSPFTYDATGNVTSDASSGNTYLYDGEGRICAVASSGPLGGTILTGYIYDADGTRVAKGTIQRWGTCDPATNGFQATTDYVLGPGGQQLTEMAVGANSQMAWKHTNVWAGSNLLATYDHDGLHYHLSDWLGSRRVQTDGAGAVEDACTSLPFGDSLNCIGPTFTTEHHFTGKERDQESGNDYFGARYYASTMGHFLSPDPKVMTARHVANPQKWNKYAYVINNPLMRFDPDGMDDYVVFRAFSGMNAKQWAAAEKAITSSRDSQGRLNTFHMGALTAEAFNKALSTPDTHVIFVGHSISEHEGGTPWGITLQSSGDTWKTVSLGSGGTLHAPDISSLTPFSPTSDGPVTLRASEVALFACNSYDLASQYAGSEFTGVQSGSDGGTDISTIDLMAADWLTAGGGQAGVNAANADINASVYPTDTGDNVESESPAPPPPPASPAPQ
jgi:RHS repeat-associated protein